MNERRRRIKERKENNAEKMRKLKESMKLLNKMEKSEEDHEIVSTIRSLMESGEDIDIVLEEVIKVVRPKKTEIKEGIRYESTGNKEDA